MTKDKMKRYCNQWWPNYKLGDDEVWPENGSVNYNTILQLMLFCRQMGKWDEVPYVDAFMTLYRKSDMREKCKLKTDPVMYTASEKKESGCCIGCDDRKTAGGEEQNDVQMLVPTAPPSYKNSAGQSIINPNLQSCNENFSPISSQTRGHTQPGVQAPLRQAVGPEGLPVFVHVPFTTSDLLNWKQSVGSYRGNPEGVHQLLETIMLTHNPNWGDIQALLNTFFTAEEKRMVIERAREEGGRRNRQEDSEEFLPTKRDPEWDPNGGGNEGSTEAVSAADTIWGSAWSA